MTTEFPDSYAGDPERVAYTMADSGRQVTYAELVADSRAVSSLLWSRGCRHGDCVAIVMENNAEFLKVAWAAQRSGFRYVALSTRLTVGEVAYILADCAARVVLTSRMYEVLVLGAVDAMVTNPDLFTVDSSVRGLDGLFDVAAATPPVDVPECEGVDLLYSSGTTGRPKGVVSEISLEPLGTAPGVADLLKGRWGFDRDTVYLSPAPLYHAAPLRFVMTVQRCGGTVVVMERFDAAVALHLVEHHRVTHTQMVPTMFIRMLGLPEQQRLGSDVSSLSAVIHAAAPCPIEVKRRMIDWLGPIVHEFYSCTENYLFTALDSEEWLAHPGSVGRPLLGMVHVLDDSGAEVPAGEDGQIWAEGGHRFEYLGDPAKTASSRNDRGWTTVGDIGRVDADGYLTLSDRRTDLILSGGVNIYPREAEDVLAVHPAVADAAVFGIPDDELGQVVHAVVQPMDADADQDALEGLLLEHCRAELARHKCPRRIDFATELPRHATGKLYKRLLQDRYSVGH
ncbi:AMP-binding protein [Gordonia hydrophobica]|uniref:AMP-binding protein n=1 Tax=Gordonia hydrophobica TaxID=40516 RepID=A0ABZ2TWC8_9ACTN|nr:AMP-binding protein [Gordonia hydrophobica]MBM7365802.1 fatty-acyl-CoA synthase [Gordonia hydrophobica]